MQCRQVAHRAPDNLGAIDVGSAPAEVAPLVADLNRLFERVRASIDNERRFTADAAHELRTPLAAIRAQAQVARGATVWVPLPADDPRQRRPDISLAREKLDWEPKIQLREGLQLTIDYFDRQLAGYAQPEPADAR